MGRANNFGFLRLLFACLVIVSHAPELIDGNRSRELLTQAFHSLSFGELAVDGFFLISGYMVTGSYMSSASTANFVAKRILRIYPAFCVAWLICLLLVTPYSGAQPWPFDAGHSLGLLLAMLNLDAPFEPGAFHALHYPALNGAMWTISYEFRCYIFLAAAGSLGLLNRRYVLLLISVSLILARTASLQGDIHLGFEGSTFGRLLNFIFIDPNQFLRLMAMFSVGVCYRLFCDKIIFTRLSALLCAVILIELLKIPSLADFGVMFFGAYVLFFVALSFKNLWLRTINSRVDISYGVYLYAWPILSLFILHDPLMTPAALAAVTLVLSACAGYVSWYAVEKPALSLKAKWGREGGGRKAMVLEERRIGAAD